MTKFTLLATAALIAVSSAASAGANNPTLAESIKANWEAKNDDTLAERQALAKQHAEGDKAVAKEEKPAKKAKKKFKKKKAAAKAEVKAAK